MVGSGFIKICPLLTSSLEAFQGCFFYLPSFYTVPIEKVPLLKPDYEKGFFLPFLSFSLISKVPSPYPERNKAESLMTHASSCTWDKMNTVQSLREE